MGGGKKAKAPAAPDYAALQKQDALANQQTAQYLTAANRPTQIDAWGNTLSWTQGTPTQSAEYNQAKADYDNYVAYAATRKDWDPKLIAQDAAKYKAKMDALENKNATWTQNQTLSPEFKAAQQAALTTYQNAANQLATQGAFNAPGMDEANAAYARAIANGDFNPNAYGSIGDFTNTAGTIGDFDRTQGDRVAADMYEAAMSRLRPEQQRDTAALDNQLRLQGLQPGTEAYNRAAQNLMTSQGDVNAKLGLDSTAAGYQAARDIYNTNLAGQGQRYSQLQNTYTTNLAGQGQRFNQGLQGYQANTAQDWAAQQAAAALQQQQYDQALQNYSLPMQRAASAAQLFAGAPQPQWQGFSAATGYNPADMTGAANASYQAKMGAANAGQGKKNSLLSAGSNLGSAWLMK